MFNAKPHVSRWHGGFSMHLHGPVFKQGPDAPEGSEYVRAKRELWATLVARHPHVATTLLARLAAVPTFVQLNPPLVA